MSDIAVVVMSCDKNTWLLDVFFERFFFEWKNCQYDIYLVMEEKKYNYKDYSINVFTTSKNTKWCARLKKALNCIKEKYVLIFLDDFILESAVNTELLEEYIKIIKENNLSNLILTPVDNEKNDNFNLDSKIIKRNRFGRYKTSLQCGIWEKSILEELLLDTENAWEFEIFGNIRSFLVKDQFYAVRNRDFKPFDYNDGFFVVQGRVNLEEKKKIEKKIGRDIYIGNMPIFKISDEIIRDDITLVNRVIRRLKIIFQYIYYIIRYIFWRRKI